jgi:lysozyme
VTGVKSLDQPLVTHEFDALVSFAFNCGVGSLMGGIATNLKAHDKENAMETLRQYIHAGSEVLPGLVVRRDAESNLFLYATYLPPAA